MELDPQSVGDLIIPPGPQFQITKHLNFVILTQGANTFCRCFEFEALKVEMDPQRMGNLLIPLGPQFQITKHLNLAILVHGAKMFFGFFEFEAL
jgi:hypothetical protein